MNPITYQNNQQHQNCDSNPEDFSESEPTTPLVLTPISSSFPITIDDSNDLLIPSLHRNEIENLFIGTSFQARKEDGGVSYYPKTKNSAVNKMQKTYEILQKKAVYLCYKQLKDAQHNPFLSNETFKALLEESGKQRQIIASQLEGIDAQRFGIPRTHGLHSFIYPLFYKAQSLILIQKALYKQVRAEPPLMSEETPSTHPQALSCIFGTVEENSPPENCSQSLKNPDPTLLCMMNLWKDLLKNPGTRNKSIKLQDYCCAIISFPLEGTGLRTTFALRLPQIPPFQQEANTNTLNPIQLRYLIEHVNLSIKFITNKYNPHSEMLAESELILPKSDLKEEFLDQIKKNSTENMKFHQLTDVSIIHQELQQSKEIKEQIYPLFSKIMAWKQKEEVVHSQEIEMGQLNSATAAAGGTLTQPTDVTLLKDLIARFVYYSHQACFFKRGSAATTEWMEMALYAMHGYNCVYPLRRYLCFDSLTLSLPDFLTTYQTLMKINPLSPKETYFLETILEKVAEKGELASFFKAASDPEEWFFTI